MEPQTQKESVSKLAYLIVILLSVIQGIIITGTLDYSIRTNVELDPIWIYLPMVFAIFVPSVISFLITNAKQPAFYLNIILTIILIGWINTWQNLETGSSSSSEPFLAVSTLTVLIFFLLPWMQNRQATGRWKAHYSCLVGHYFRNTLFGFFACAIGGLLAFIVKQASFLFGIVNLTTLSHFLNNDYILWVAFLLGFNISVLFLRSKLVMQLNNIAKYFSQFFLPLLSLIAVIFLVGLAISLFTGVHYTASELGSGTMLCFVILNVIFINALYGDGSTQFQFKAIINGFVLISIVLLNAFSALSLYGILVRVNQYSWSVSRLYAFAIALFLAILILAYSITVMIKRRHWANALGSINKVAILGLIATILVINSPIGDFQRITVNSIMAAVEKGKIKINYDLSYDLEKLGERGKAALALLEQNPETKAQLKVGAYSDTPKPFKEVLIIAKGSQPLPQSWFDMEDGIRDSWNCISYYRNYECLGFMADVNSDGADEVVMCYSMPESLDYECTIWQAQANTWNLVDTQKQAFDDTADKKAAWDNLLNNQFKLQPKTWLEIVPE
ncbi:TPA: DUF7057 domain-containing protein [Providencia alcalifaciens]|uniref:DUF7057 domain-containing protein n=1 Tax=Providencia alcalifaciens TaxID=126385 RepID=UPI000D99B478|nr:DUF4153 domain-containing protein [Providencia alcalifaciens]MTC26417.1 DUF4153 domain-containing protein [Providencia alcalifaciens]SPY67989.1 Uncharacterised protein [Providencia alcalifaciens]